jgi:hypothetical protein
VCSIGCICYYHFSDITSLVTNLGSTIPTTSPGDDEIMPQRSASRRSSLESDYEPELEQCSGEMSRPSTAGEVSRTESRTNTTDIPSVSAPPIEIPQMTDDESVPGLAHVAMDTDKNNVGNARHDHVAFETDANIVNKEDGLGSSRPVTGRGSRSASRSSIKMSRSVKKSPMITRYLHNY